MAKKKRRPSSSGILLFIAAFVVSLAVCSGIAYLWWQWTDPQITWFHFLKPDAVDTITDNETSPYSQKDRFSFSIYLTDDTGTLQTVSLVTVCPDTAELSTVGLPAELSLSDTDSSDTLQRRFQLDGITAAQTALGRFLTTTPDYYLVLSYSDAEAFFEALATPLIVDLPKDVNEQSENGDFSVHLSAGENALSAHQIKNLLCCTGWQDGKRERATMHARIIDAYLKQFLTDGRGLQSDYTLLTVHAQTNLSGEQFPAILPYFNHIIGEQNASSPALIPTTGTFSGVGVTLHFVPDDALMNAVSARLRDDTVKSNAAAIPAT